MTGLVHSLSDHDIGIMQSDYAACDDKSEHAYSCTLPACHHSASAGIHDSYMLILILTRSSGQPDHQG